VGAGLGWERKWGSGWGEANTRQTAHFVLFEKKKSCTGSASLPSPT
jgi:hypothetical protein